MKPTPDQLKSLHHILISTVAPLSECLTVVIDHWEAIRAAPEPLTFPDPPHGWKWHNPANLTPEQVGIADGWRLCLGEETSLPNECYIQGNWSIAAHDGGPFLEMTTTTYRTKAPLPAPKPTPEEIEAAEIEAAWIEAKWPLGFPVFKSGWKAAKKGTPTP